GQEQRFELRRRHRAALVLDQLLDAVHHEEVAVRVGIADVAGVQPALGIDHGRGGVGPAQVALHHLWPAHADLALFALTELGPAGGVDDLAFGVHDDGTHRPWFRLRTGADVDVRHRTRLRHPVPLHDAAAHPAGHLAGELGPE